MVASAKNILPRAECKILTEMKRVVIILLIQILFVSCGKYLNKYPHSGTPREHITNEDAGLLVTGMYNIAQYKPTFNGWALFDLIGGDIIRTGATSANTPKLLVEGAIAPNASIVTSPWNGYFAGLYQINSTLSVIESMPESQEKREMLGTCHFFRGLYYYNIVTRWRNVPIITGQEGEKQQQKDEDLVWQFVKEEFRQAYLLSADFTDKNYVSKEAAQALMARTCLAMGLKEEAKSLAEGLIENEKFSLSDFNDIFRGRNNKEEIFTFANLVQESSVNMSSYYYTKESGVGGGYNFCPTSEAMAMYEDNDKRKEISIAYQGNGQPVLNKYCSGDAGRDPLYIVRLAEMYLISAECQGYPKGLDRLNELRAFRGLDAVNPTDQESFIDAVLDERRLELFGEGFRWYDLVRTGRYTSVIGVDDKYSVLPIPARELSLNGNLRQHPLWETSGAI